MFGLKLQIFSKPGCKLTRVGIPLYNAMMEGVKYGAYLKDPMPRRKGYADKIWITKGYLSKIVLIAIY